MTLSAGATDYLTKRPTASTRLLLAACRVFDRRQRYETAQSIDRLVAHQTARPASDVPPCWLGFIGSVTRRDRRGWPTWQLQPGRQLPGASSVVYLHGGSYISEISALHWYFLGRLVAAGVRCTVPIYPLAPAATATTTVAAAADVLAELFGEDPGTLIGDSAGAGLALAATQQLHESNRHQPEHLVLLSPWLDATVSHPDQPAIAEHDPVLAIAGLRRAGALYAGGLPAPDRRPSPLYGPMTGLPAVTMIAGARDLLVTDARRLVEELGRDDNRVDYREHPGQPHGFALLPTREGAAARRAIVQVLLERGPACSPTKR